MTEKNTFLDKQCPFYWENEIGNNSIFGKVMDLKTLKCIVPQSKKNQEGEPGCCFHGSSPPVCSCLGKYRKSNMKKIGSNLWECPLCQGKITGSKNEAGYLDFDYVEYRLRK